MIKGIAAAAAVAGVLAASSANALILDLTQIGLSDQTAAGEATPIVVENGENSVTFVVTVVGSGTATFQNPSPTGVLPSFCGLLSCAFGGAGIANDDIATGELLRVSLSQDDIDDGYSLNFQEFFFLNLALADEAQLRYNAGGIDDSFTGSASGAVSATPTSGDAEGAGGVILGADGTYSLAGFRFDLLLNGSPPASSEDVPLPATLPLMLVGLAGLGAMRRRSRSHS